MLLFLLLHIVLCMAASKSYDSKRDPDLFHFVTRPDLESPRWNVNVHRPDLLTPGVWFVAPYAGYNGEGPSGSWIGPAIYDQDGELIWSGARLVSNANVADFRISNVGGGYYMTYMNAGAGRAYILNGSYEVAERIELAQPFPDNTNVHELNFVDHGAGALVIRNHWAGAPLDQSADIGYTKGACSANYEGFVELDTNTWNTTFSWSSEGHIALGESTFTGETEGHTQADMCNGWDFIHSNSLDKTADGNYLYSSRHTNTIYKISAKDGSIIWRFGGSRSDFEQGDLVFSRQHDVRFRGQNETHTLVSFLDNAKGQDLLEPTYKSSRGLLIALQTDSNPMKATIAAQYDHPNGTGSYAFRRGNYQALPDGNVFMGWSEQLWQSEHTANGTLIITANLKTEWLGGYRSYKFDNFVGHPRQEDIAVVSNAVQDAETNETNIAVYTSWNGATEVASWSVYAPVDGSPPSMELLASVPKSGFETTITSDFAEHIMVFAGGANGTVLGSSNLIETYVPDGMEVIELMPMDVTNEGSRLIILLVACGVILTMLLAWLEASRYRRSWFGKQQRGWEYFRLKEGEP